MYDIDAEGFLLGRPTDGRVGAVTVPLPSGIAPHLARWNGSAWSEDTSREARLAAEAEADRQRLRAAFDKCKAYDPATATAADVRVTLGASLYLLSRVIQELRG
jgi:hypothetical protein